MSSFGNSVSSLQLQFGNSFYRRALPSSCVDFASDEGKKLFSEALKAGFMNIYFKLASQFKTQEEPAFCGISTLVMVLNALEVDPGRVWKAPWRWYHESMLGCCRPLEDDTGSSRGYSVLKLSPRTHPLTLFHVNFGLGATLLAMDRLKLWKNWLSDSNFDQETVFSQSVDRFMQIFGDIPIFCKEELKKNCCDDTDRALCEWCIQIEQDIRKTQTFRAMERASDCQGKKIIGLCAGFLACCPLDGTGQSEKSVAISRNVITDLELLGKDARNEIQQLNLYRLEH